MYFVQQRKTLEAMKRIGDGEDCAIMSTSSYCWRSPFSRTISRWVNAATVRVKSRRAGTGAYEPIDTNIRVRVKTLHTTGELSFRQWSRWANGIRA